MTDYKQLCAELVAALEEEASNWNLDPECHPLVVRARAALAETEPASEPEDPTDQELLRLYKVATPCYHVEEYRRELDFARAVLARWGGHHHSLFANAE